MKKILASTVLTAAVLFGFAESVSAHTPTVTGTCTVDGALLTVRLEAYEKGSTVSINGRTVTFDKDYKATFGLGTPKANHTWTVTIDNRGDGVRDEWDRTMSGTVLACAKTDIDLTPTTVPTTVPKVVEPAGKVTPVVPKPAVVDPPVLLSSTVLPREVDVPEQTLPHTGASALQLALAAGTVLVVGVWMLIVARGIRKEALR